MEAGHLSFSAGSLTLCVCTGVWGRAWGQVCFSSLDTTGSLRDLGTSIMAELSHSSFLGTVSSPVGETPMEKCWVLEQPSPGQGE